MPEEPIKRGPGRPPRQPSPETVAPEPSVETVYPDRIKLTAPHGFVDDDGNHRYWFQNMVVETVDEIKLLIDRGVEFLALD